MPTLPRLQTVALAILTFVAGAAWQTAALAADTPIYTIQGSGSASPLVGQTVTTTGVVTKLNNNGFFLQDLIGDNNPATSDGIFIFTSTAPTVAVGQYLRMSGRVTEFDTSGATANPIVERHPITELTFVSGVTVLGTGYTIAPTALPFPEVVDDDLERYEGMLVRIVGPLTVSQNFFQARFGQLTLSVGGRLEVPTNRHRAGTPQVLALADENARRRIVLDDGTSQTNPNPTPFASAGVGGVPRAGDTVAELTGVIDYGLATASNGGLGDYRIHPTVAPVFIASHPRTAAPTPTGGNVRVASFNVLNYFTTFTNGMTASGQVGQGCTLGSSTAASNCRGANNRAEFLRQRSKIVLAMAAIDADVFGLMEIQNNGSVAAANLVDALNAKVGSGTYAVVADPAEGTGTDAIKVAMVYKPARLSRIGTAVSDTAAVNNRPTLAQTFSAANGERFTVVVNHFKSKGGCPAAGDSDAAGNIDSGDGQGCWNALRTLQASQLRSFVARLQTSAASNDVMVIGDLNAYGQEDPIYQLTSSGWVDQFARFNPFAYSYVFDGAAGRLDHALTTASLSARVVGVQAWHVNADESSAQDYNLEFKAPLTTCGGRPCPPDPYTTSPYRSSDHDPVIVGLSLYKTVSGSSGRDTLVGTPGDDRLAGGVGADTLTGGAGRNVFVYTSLRDAGDIITDFVPGKDQIELSALLASLRAAPATAFSSGIVKLVSAGAHTLLQIDIDGSAGPSAARTLATMLNLNPSQISASRDLGVQ